MPTGLSFNLQDHIELVDVTGRATREDKRGYIDNSLSPILERLTIDSKKWMVLTQQFESQFKTLVGRVDKIQNVKKLLDYQRASGLAQN